MNKLNNLQKILINNFLEKNFEFSRMYDKYGSDITDDFILLINDVLGIQKKKNLG